MKKLLIIGVPLIAIIAIAGSSGSSHGSSSSSSTSTGSHSTGSHSSSKPKPKPGKIRATRCAVRFNADGSANADVSLWNPGGKRDNVAVITTLKLYGGNTKDDSSWLNTPTYDLPHGFARVTNNFALGLNDDPISCSAEVLPLDS